MVSIAYPFIARGINCCTSNLIKRINASLFEEERSQRVLVLSTVCHMIMVCIAHPFFVYGINCFTCCSRPLSMATSLLSSSLWNVKRKRFTIMPTLCHPLSQPLSILQLPLIHLKTLLLNEESIFQMRISVMRVALSMKTFLTIVCRVAMRQKRSELKTATMSLRNYCQWQRQRWRRRRRRQRRRRRWERQRQRRQGQQQNDSDNSDEEDVDDGKRFRFCCCCRCSCSLDVCRTHKTLNDIILYCLSYALACSTLRAELAALLYLCSVL